GRDETALSRIGAFVELHVEQGRALVDLDAAVGVASAIWPHGRWRCTFRGEGNHAGTTRLVDRHDPMLPYAATVLAAREIASELGEVPVLPTGAGHDAGILSAVVPTAMLFVRNPSGVSHSPAESASLDDCVAGIEALATVLEELAR